jgi:type I restriction enzyme, S subunit
MSSVPFAVPFSELVEVNPPTPVPGKLVPFVGMEDVSEDSQLLRVRERKMSELSPGQPAFRDGDVLFAKITPCMENGKGAYVHSLEGRNAFGSTEFHVLRVRSGNSSKFVYHWTRSHRLRLAAEAMMTGSAGQRRVPAEFFNRFFIPAFPFEEQQRIAEILGTIDESIRLGEVLSRKLMRSRNAAAVQLNADVETARKPISVLCERIVDCPHTTPNFCDYGLLVARTSNIRDGKFITAGASRVSEQEYSQRIARLEPKPDDIIFCREAPVGEAFVIPDGMKICLGQRTTLLRTERTEILPGYLLEQIYSDDFKKQLASAVSGTTNPHLNVQDIPRLLISVPDIDTQRRILRILGGFSSRIDLLDESISQLKQVRTGLMDDLLTGMVRVTDGGMERVGTD